MGAKSAEVVETPYWGGVGNTRRLDRPALVKNLLSREQSNRRSSVPTSKDALPDYIAFEFRHSPDDREHGFVQWSTAV